MERSFQELWDGSRVFRQIFLHNGIFKSVNEIDLGKAEAFWYDRFPRLKWDFCGVDGCVNLVVEGECCKRHLHHSGVLPHWQWDRGILYKYLAKRERIATSLRMYVKRYKAYHLYLAQKTLGEIPAGYTVYYRDGNPFNLRYENFVIISNIMMAAVRDGVVTVAKAVELDSVLMDILFTSIGRGRPRSQWVYTIDGIAKAAKIRTERVRQEISRKNIDPSDLASVVDFCHKMKNGGGILQEA